MHGRVMRHGQNRAKLKELPSACGKRCNEALGQGRKMNASLGTGHHIKLSKLGWTYSAERRHGMLHCTRTEQES